MLRIGQGYDAHRFKEGGQLVLGGVAIDYEKSLAAHSDGDVALHALCDALLGAAALGDIGRHFPDSDPKFKGIDSRVLLRDVHAKIVENGYSVCNVDLTIVAQQPRLAPYIEKMRTTIADDLAIAYDAVNVKATTTEGMGFEGRGEGISAYAVALLRKT
ncbi:2-C-methyl-D-erythritol 2,4-cyclodiphosphate synthase [Methylocaldum szegediense]|uniref:2-C-methyl-D-erythritol 2,4-cyclodiphosphate synthase n=1 Tax=Methylocaldum szegediense TaxID=73780 RepID=A0ABN8XDP5_9GAMM|nr:2-C-methyl-D-erythritol 2,4-cyclodiphosphate synthase [Methylocaldum szegediense]CAI8953338.1 2-C-methyl-D-erythritol 2,4-cyclodiphosphate synthase [Methylocaldum szegediense]